ncbi:MAG: LysR substrate-binding domain-containing protein [Woeseiaceae bacterium]|nr:LysR substrate-binding domain-containing protein [Woeseiaceae bacterium]
MARKLQWPGMASTRPNYSLRALRVFCAAARYESFRRAAEASYLTASAVSHQIRQLESALGRQLFERTPRSLRLTSEGKAFYEDIKPILDELDASVARHSEQTAARTLRISVQPFFASELFIPKLNEFLLRHPDLDIRVDTSDETLEKHPEAADVSIRVFSRAPDSLDAERLFSLRLVPAGSLDFYDNIRVRGGRIVSDFPLVLHETWPNAWRDWSKRARLRLPDPKNTIRMASMIAVARAAERGLGAALIPRRLCEAWFDSNSLVQLFDEELETTEAYYIVSRKDDSENRDLQAFKSWVLQEFADPG